MIKENMFYGERTIKEYRDIKLDDVIKEYLLTKGTWNREGKPCNIQVTPKQLVSSCLFVYELKSNTTNKRASEYYCEREARIRQIMNNTQIMIPQELWEECDKRNREFTKKDLHYDEQTDL